jgi:hypothetical protein
MMRNGKDDESMSDRSNPSRFSIENYRYAKETKPPRVRLPSSVMTKNSFAKMGGEEIAAFGRFHDPAVALHLELIRLSGTRWAKQRDGWIPFNREILENIGLNDKFVRHRAVQRLVDIGCMEARLVADVAGRRLEYRLRPNWANPKAKVVDLAAVRKARKRAR